MTNVIINLIATVTNMTKYISYNNLVQKVYQEELTTALISELVNKLKVEKLAKQILELIK